MRDLAKPCSGMNSFGTVSADVITSLGELVCDEADPADDDDVDELLRCALLLLFVAADGDDADELDDGLLLLVAVLS